MLTLTEHEVSLLKHSVKYWSTEAFNWCGCIMVYASRDENMDVTGIRLKLFTFQEIDIPITKCNEEMSKELLPILKAAIESEKVCAYYTLDAYETHVHVHNRVHHWITVRKEYIKHLAETFEDARGDYHIDAKRMIFEFIVTIYSAHNEPLFSIDNIPEHIVSSVKRKIHSNMEAVGLTAVIRP